MRAIVFLSLAAAVIVAGAGTSHSGMNSMSSSHSTSHGSSHQAPNTVHVVSGMSSSHTSSSSSHTNTVHSTSHSTSHSYGECEAEYASCLASPMGPALIDQLSQGEQITSGGCTCRPATITFSYTGGDCSATTNWQSGKFSCSASAGDSGLASTSVTTDAAYISSGASAVTVGSTFSISGTDGGKLAANTLFQVSGPSAHVVMSIHTSCSKPLVVGDVYGPLTLVSMSCPSSSGSSLDDNFAVALNDLLEGGGIDAQTQAECGSLVDCLAPGACGIEFLTCTKNTNCHNLLVALYNQFTNPPSSSADLCESCKRPSSLDFTIPAFGNCATTTNWQSGKFVCTDNAAPTGSSFNVVSMTSGSSFAHSGGVWTLSSTSGALSANTVVNVYESGVLVQSMTIHTSCSKPIMMGDQYGTLHLTGFACSATSGSGSGSMGSSMSSHSTSHGTSGSTSHTSSSSGVSDSDLMAMLENPAFNLTNLDAAARAQLTGADQDAATDLYGCLIPPPSPTPIVFIGPETPIPPGGIPFAPDISVFGPEMSLIACAAQQPGNDGYIVFNGQPGSPPCIGWTMDGPNNQFTFRYDNIVVRSDPDPVPFDGNPHHVAVVVRYVPRQSCTCHPGSITFQYIAGNTCASSTNDQSGKFTCSTSGSGVLGSSVSIASSQSLSQSTVSDGQTFNISGSNGGKVSAQSTFTLTDGSTTQSLSIHTSCSKPMSVGDVFGSLRIVAMTCPTGGSTSHSSTSHSSTSHSSTSHSSTSTGTSHTGTTGTSSTSHTGTTGTTSSTSHTGTTGTTSSTSHTGTTSSTSHTGSTSGTGSSHTGTSSSESEPEIDIEIRFFVNGLLTGTIKTIAPSVYPETCAQQSISGLNYTGSLANVVLYDVPLEDQEIADIASTVPCGGGDVTPPVGSYCLSTSNSNPSFARDGDTVTVTVTANEPIEVPTVTCSSDGSTMRTYTVATGSSGSTSFTMTYTMTSADASGTITCSVTMVDLAGNNAPATQNPTSGCSLTVDNVSPSAVYCVSCSNPFDTTVAGEGDLVTVIINATEPISTPSVTCGGIVFSVVATSDTVFTATHTVTGLDPEGRLVCVVDDFTDLTSGNPGTASQIQLSQCFVDIDVTPPAALFCSSSNPGQVTPGDSVTVVVTADEPIRVPTISCNGQTLSPVVGSEPTTTYSATFAITSGTAEGQITCSVTNVVDVAGALGTSSVNPNQATCFPTAKINSDSPTPSPSPSRSPSPSPSVSPIPIALQVSFGSETGACRTVGCVDEDPVLDNVTTRVYAFPERVEDIGSDTAKIIACISTGGTYKNSKFCFKSIPFANVTTYSVPGDFELFKRAANFPPGPPSFLTGQTPRILPANQYPNRAPNEAIAAIVDCRGQPTDQIIRFAWLRNQPGPCFFDNIYSRNICSAPGKADQNEQFQNTGGAVMPDDAIFDAIRCP